MKDFLKSSALVLVAPLAAFGSEACVEAPCEDAPNIVFFVVDDLGYNDIGYHSDLFMDATPTMSDLAATGVKLENFYVSPTCTPTRSQLMTGKYQIHTGMQDSVIHATEPRGVPLEHSFISEKLQSLGYATYLVGKWHLGFHTSDYIPTNRGFDHFYDILTGGGSHYDHESTATFTPRGGYDNYVITADNLCEDHAAVSVEDQPSTEVHTTTMYTEQALTYITDQPADQPFFMYLSYQAVHGPIQADAEYYDGSELGRDPAYPGSSGCELIDENNLEDEGTDYIMRMKLCAMVSMIDEGLYKVKSLLEETDRWDDTVIFFMSDNGGITSHGSSNYPLRGGKGDYWEGGLRVPAFVSGGYTMRALEAASAKPYTTTDLWHVTDLFATSVGLAGGDVMNSMDIDGVMQWDTLVAGSEVHTPRTEILHNVNSKLFASGGAIRVGDYKLVCKPPLEESEIYTYGLNILADHDKSYDDLNSILTDLVFETYGDTEYYLYNVVKNPSEIDDGGTGCADFEQCNNLFGIDAYADIRDEIMAKFGSYGSNAEASSEMWDDDGILTHPDLFGGTWGPWRDTDGVPYAMYSVQDASLGASALRSDGNHAADLNLAARFASATDSPSIASVACLVVGVFAGAMGVVALAEAKRNREYTVIV